MALTSRGLPSLVVAALLAGLAVALVAASSRVQRVGGRAVYNDECANGLGEAACLEDQEVAGLPFAYLVDTPGVSVEHYVSPFEDRFLPWVFALDVVLVWGAFLGAWWIARRRFGSARRTFGSVAILGLAVVFGAGCGTAPAKPVPAERPDGRTVEVYFPDPETGRLTQTCPDPTPTTVTFDSVASEGGRLTLVGRAEIEGRGGFGFVRFVREYDRTGIPEPMGPPERPGPYPMNGPPLAEGALAYGATLYRSGRFALRAPEAEVATDTLLFAYECADVDDWVRVPVADVLAGVRVVASEPGAVANPEARGWRGLRLRPDERAVSLGDSVRFVLSFRPPPPEAPFPRPPGWMPPLSPVRGESPSFGESCQWRVERWDGRWTPVPLRWWRDAQDGLYECVAIGNRFIARAERRAAFRLATDAEPGWYRWCLDAHDADGDRQIERAVCSTSFLVTP